MRKVPGSSALAQSPHRRRIAMKTLETHSSSLTSAGIVKSTMNWVRQVPALGFLGDQRVSATSLTLGTTLCSCVPQCRPKRALALEDLTVIRPEQRTQAARALRQISTESRRTRCHCLHSNYMLNRGYAYTTTIRSICHGQTLLSHLATVYPHSTLQAWQQRLNRGEVTLNGVTATGSESVYAGEALVWNRPPWIEPDSPQHFEVLFDDPHLLAVNKPSGLPTLPGGGFMENTLLHLVKNHTPNANPLHRLGRATSGIVLFAKSTRAASNLVANWNTSKIQKTYRALAQNVARHDAYEILTPIGLVPHPLIGSVWAANPSGKPSKSLAGVISRTKSTTTFEVSLCSGRPHQIRIHLASIGHPLIGDALYDETGRPLRAHPGLPGDGGYLLHAQFLNFSHPITGEQIHLEAALPSAFAFHT